METEYIQKIMTQFRSVALNSVGIERELYSQISKRDINAVLMLMQNNDMEVDKAIREYNPQTHPVMMRPNKIRKNQPAYITEKLPRTKQRYVNEIELFFLLGKPVVWKKEGGDDEVFELYKSFWRDYRMDSVLRRAKRLAGAETESAIVMHLSNRNGNVEVKPFVAARKSGYRLRPLFDQYGKLVALAYLYRLREGRKNVLHCDIHTAEFVFYCKNGKDGWSVETYGNPTEKINAVYFAQDKSWDGVVPRMEREEMLDSKVGDTNNYFADPKAAATADVVANILDPDIAGQMVQLNSRESRFEYINPPSNSVTRQDEKSDLSKSILFDTFTPDFSYESIKGLGSLSGSAIKNAMILAYIKRDNRVEIYGEAVDRLKNVIIAVLPLIYPEKAAKFADLRMSFEFPDPFSDKREKWEAIIKLYKAGLCSLETAVKEIALVDDIDEEIDRLKMAQAELEFIKNEAQGKPTEGGEE